MDWIFVYGVVQTSLECRDVAQVISSLFFYVFEARVQCQVMPYKIDCVEIGTGADLFAKHLDLPLSLLFHHCSKITFMCMLYLWGRKYWRRMSTFQEKKILVETREHYLDWYKKYFHFFKFTWQSMLHKRKAVLSDFCATVYESDVD
jgi:hypothetical protein